MTVFCSIFRAQAALWVFFSKYHAGVRATHSHLLNRRDVSRETVVLFLSRRYQPKSAASSGNQRPQLGAAGDRRVCQTFGVLFQDDAAREEHEGQTGQDEEQAIAHAEGILAIFDLASRGLQAEGARENVKFRGRN